MKLLIEEEADRIRCSKLKRRSWQMVSTRAGNLYWVGEDVAIKDRDSSRAIVIYPLAGQQPRTCRGIAIDPNRTRKYIASCINSGTKKEIWSKLGSIDIEKILGITIVGGAIIWYGLSLIGI